MKNKINYKAKNRQDAVEQGFYDGRFRTKLVPNKKHKILKFKYAEEEDDYTNQEDISTTYTQRCHNDREPVFQPDT